MEADQLGRLHDILEATRLIAAYVKDTTASEFQADTQKQDAVIRRIEIIGEATAHLSEATRREIPELPFRRMRPDFDRSSYISRSGFQQIQGVTARFRPKVLVHGYRESA